jgi:hypothetical protein
LFRTCLWMLQIWKKHEYLQGDSLNGVYSSIYGLWSF